MNVVDAQFEPKGGNDIIFKFNLTFKIDTFKTDS